MIEVDAAPEDILEIGRYRAEADIFRAHDYTKIAGVAVRPGVCSGQRQAALSCHPQGAVVGADVDYIEDVRGTNEACYESRSRRLVDLARCADLLQSSLVQQGDPIRHRHRLLLVMRHHNRGDRQRLLQPADFNLHFRPQMRIQATQRLIQQQHRGPRYERPGQCHPLLLSAG